MSVYSVGPKHGNRQTLRTSNLTTVERKPAVRKSPNEGSSIAQLRKNYLLLLGVIIAGGAIVAFANRAEYSVASHPEEDTATLVQKYEAMQDKAMAAENGDIRPIISEATYGDPHTAKLRVTLGFTASDYIAQNTDAENTIVHMLAGWAGSDDFSSLRVICVDIPVNLRSDPSTADVPVGVTLNGKVITTKDIINVGAGGYSPYGVADALYKVSGPMLQAERTGHKISAPRAYPL